MYIKTEELYLSPLVKWLIRLAEVVTYATSRRA